MGGGGAFCPTISSSALGMFCETRPDLVVGVRGHNLLSAETSDSVVGLALAAPLTWSELDQHPAPTWPCYPPTANSWIQCSWIPRPWTTLMPTATSHPSSWRSVRPSASGPTLSGTLSSPCKVSKGQSKQVEGSVEVICCGLLHVSGHRGWRLHPSRPWLGYPCPLLWISIPHAPCSVYAYLMQPAQHTSSPDLRGRFCLFGEGPLGAQSACLRGCLYNPHPQCCQVCSRMWRLP